jgi:WhiB family redox-sensing transcriptional regulator
MGRADHLALDERDLSALTSMLMRAHRTMDDLRYPRAAPHPIDGRDWREFRGDAPFRAPRAVAIVRAADRNVQMPGNWVEHAACKGQTRTMFVDNFPVLAHRETALERRQMKDAKRVCESCPVLEPCRAWALTDPDPAIDGVAGGMTPRERWEARRR